jgi:hypothetical protein
MLIKRTLPGQIPITASSVAQKLGFTSEFVPVPTLPFRASMFPEISALFPYFAVVLTHEAKHINASLKLLIFA